MGQQIIVKDVRCSFPQLYSASLNEGQEYNPGIILILEAKKHAKDIAKIKAAINNAINSNAKIRKAKESGALGPDRICLRKPTDDNCKYLEDNLILKAGNPRPPLVLCPDGVTPMTEATNKIYSGCYVNAKFEIWGQDNRFGKRVNAKIIAVQYVPKEAESFDGSYVSPEVAAQGFEPLEDDPTGGGFLDTDTPAADEDDLLS